MPLKQLNKIAIQGENKNKNKSGKGKSRKNKSVKVPRKYLPDYLKNADKAKVKVYLNKSRKLYKTGKYFKRPKVVSYKSRKSAHLKRAEKMYNVKNIVPSIALAKASHCSLKTLKKIVNKGKGAYYSSGSRPNQTAESWGYARLASALTGGKSAIVDFHLLNSGCDHKKSKAYKLARKTCKKYNVGFCK